ncbi:hypothetical protein J2S43_001207 [Catenuloplanes nepalensis]|uniref:DUF4185 domain-containing protein n=1 Tax=Catenuloplanes nepalensis TaxID=587533 RepID=A0ABT9MMN3_9ACTN|nr:hypothetical protein [Catenuloplanes nepalensis]MDP9792695.1 hypothetical protein [Catenuloplanes nepalensis]
MALNARVRVAALSSLVLIVTAGCDGWSGPPSAVGGTTATLSAQTRCLAQSTTNPCTYWFQYWADGATTVTSTPQRAANVNTNGFVTVTEAITGLTPGTLYHSQFCGFGDDNVAAPGLCVGQQGGAVSSPGAQPDTGDYNSTQRFRTADAGTAATVDLGRPLSTADTADRPISRDAGFSAAYSGSNALWIFGDTVHRNGSPPWLLGTTAAAGAYTRGSVPTTLQELPTPPAAPTPGRTGIAQFLPPPQGLLLPGIPTAQNPNPPPVACTPEAGSSYPASWTSGMTRIPGTERLLIVYHQICVATTRDSWPVERVTLTDYDPATNRFLSTVTPFTASPLQNGVPAGQQLGSPVFGGDGFLYFYAHDFATARVLAARVSATPSTWGNAANYGWWNGTTWTGTPATATTVIIGAPEIWSAHVMDFTGVGTHRLAMIVQTTFGTGGYRVYEATSPQGPWTAGPSGRVPDTCPGGGFGCYAFTAHAELSTADRFWLSWYSPGDRNGFAHLRLAAIPW